MPCSDSSCCLATSGDDGQVVLTEPASMDVQPFVCRMLAFKNSEESSGVKLQVGVFTFDRLIVLVVQRLRRCM